MDNSERINPKRAVVAVSLPCARCGQDLRGVRLEHECPECGHSVRQSVNRVCDPRARSLPQLTNPIAVARGLTGMTLFLAAAGLLVILPSALKTAGTLLSGREWMSADATVSWVLGAAACACLLAIAFSRLLQPKREAAAVSQIRRLIMLWTLGMLIVAGVAIAHMILETGSVVPWRRAEPTTMSGLDRAWIRLGYAVGAVGALSALGRLLTEVGKRSRTYRQSQGGRQGAQAMNIAVLLVAAGTALSLVPAVQAVAWMRASAGILVASSTLMFVIGLVYLVGNSMWIGAALRSPPMRLRDVVRIEPDSSRIIPAASRDGVGESTDGDGDPPAPSQHPAADGAGT